MTRLRGHFDGRSVVLDEAVPVDLRENAPVEVLILGDRDRALREFEAYSREFWSRPIAVGPSSVRSWRREDLYERGGHGVS